MRKIIKVKLIDYDETVDPETKDVIKKEVARVIVGNLLSVNGKEYYQAASNGLQPEVIIEIWEHEYKGERELRIKKGKEWIFYHIARDYASPRSCRLHLTCYKDLPRGDDNG